MATSDPVSVISCDLEGRLTSMNAGAERMFGWREDELVGRERVSLFSDGLTVLGHVPRWLATAVREGAWEGTTAFRRKDGGWFAARIRITPMRRQGELIGYCGVTHELAGVDPKSATPPASLATRAMRWLVITRAPFLTATLVPVLLGAAVAWGSGAAFRPGLFALALAGALLLHLGTNMANDHFDHLSGADEANADYVVPFSGGSRAIQLGLITPAALKRLAIGAFALASLCGAALFVVRGWPVLAWGAVGLFLGWCYTAPPLRLCARRGLGELATGLGFGPLMVTGTAWVLTGRILPLALLASVPVGLLVAAILLVNELPDRDGDAAAGKDNLVVVLGKRGGMRLFLAALSGAYAAIALGVATRALPVWCLAALPAGLLAWKAGRVARAHAEDRALLPAHGATIGAHLLTGLLLAASFVADRALR